MDRANRELNPELDRFNNDPKKYGNQNPDAPGEPAANLPDAAPVPGTGYEAKEEHKREHNAKGNVDDNNRLADHKTR